MCIVVFYQQPAYLGREDVGQVSETKLPESPNPTEFTQQEDRNFNEHTDGPHQLYLL
jgi:hypothetical protein